MKENPFQLRGEDKTNFRVAKQPVHLLVFIIVDIVFTECNAPPLVICGIASNLAAISHAGITSK